MIVSVHLADVGVRSALRILRRPPRPESVEGLRSADVAVAGPLRGAKAPPPQPGRVALLGFWDGDEHLDAFLRTDPMAEELSDGWSARLEPLRAFGTWPGLPDDLPRNRAVPSEGPVLVLTLGRLKLPGTIRFLRTSRGAEKQALASPGFLWGTALAKPPFVSTCSLWESADAARNYAYPSGEPHDAAIAADRKKEFHHQSAFVRFRPYEVRGELRGRNPLPPATVPVS